MASTKTPSLKHKYSFNSHSDEDMNIVHCSKSLAMTLCFCRIGADPDKLYLLNLLSATKMTGRPDHWSEPGEYNILFLGSVLFISSPKTPPHLGI